jgi:hypothetical protein
MKSHEKFLNEKSLLIIRPGVAKLLGLNESIVLQQLHYWLQKAQKGMCGKKIEGNYWIWNRIQDWHEQFPFFSESTLKRAFSSLKKEKILVISKFNGYNRINYYRIDYEILDSFLEKAEQIMTQSNESDCSNSTDQNDILYTEITAETIILEDEEVCEVEIVTSTKRLPSTLVVPTMMEHLPISLIDQAIDKAVAKLSRNSPSGYRRKLLKGLASGDEGWIETVCEFVKQIQATSEAPWIRKKRLAKEQSEVMDYALHEAGFANILDYLENRPTSPKDNLHEY